MSDSALSEGQRLLIAAGPVKAVASRLGKSSRAVSFYRAGRRPSAPVQQLMSEVLSIAPDAWARQAGSVATVRAARSILAAEVGDQLLAAIAEGPGGPGTASESESAVQRLRAQCARLRASREAGNLTPRALVELEQLELRATCQLARLTSHRFTAADILGSSHWQSLAARFTVALSAADPYGFFLLWNAVEPESTAPAEAIAQLRARHPAEVDACEAANKRLSDAMAASKTSQPKIGSSTPADAMSEAPTANPQ